jgi:single-strand DNA-binding protein
MIRNQNFEGENGSEFNYRYKRLQERQRRKKWSKLNGTKLPGETAEIIEKYVTKGKEIAIDGKLTHRSYEDKNGEKRYVTEVVASEVML